MKVTITYDTKENEPIELTVTTDEKRRYMVYEDDKMSELERKIATQMLIRDECDYNMSLFYTAMHSLIPRLFE